jgi:hypothetical protein
LGFFDISGDTVKAAEAAASFGLVEPPTAKQVKGGAGWTEYVRVKDASSETVETDTDGTKTEVLVLHVLMECDKQGSGLNEGKTFRSNMRINRAALQKGGSAAKGSPWKRQHTMSQLSIYKLKAILRACGFQPDTEDGGFSTQILAECFPGIGDFSGQASPLIGLGFWAEVRSSQSESKKDGKMYTNYDIQNVLENNG